MPCVALLALTIGTLSSAAQDDGETNAIDDMPHMTIVGTAQAEVPPDVATLSLAVVIEKPTAAAATQAAAAAMSAVVTEAKALGIGDADLQTNALMLVETFDETHDPQGHFERKPRGYQATLGLAVRFKDLTRIGTIVQALSDKGANRYNGINFSVSDARSVRDRLMGEAVRDARRQADAAASAAGIKLGRVLLIERPEATAQNHVYAMARVAAAAPVQPGLVSVDERVAVTWAIAP